MARARLGEIGTVYTTVAHSYDDLIPDTRFEAPIDLVMVQLTSSCGLRLHAPGDVRDILTAGGFEVCALLDRSARPIEKNAQGFVVATRT